MSPRQSNVLINHNGDALVSDYGVATIMAEFNHTEWFISRRPGALRWADPGLINALARRDDRRPQLHGEPQDLRYDVYAMGAIMLQALTGQVPYYPLNDLAVQLAKFRGEPPRISTRVHHKFRNLIEACWDPDRRIRPRLGEIVASVRQEMAGPPHVWRH